MKALRVHAWGEPPRLEDLPEPTAAPGRTLVCVRAATVGHIDRTIWSGAFLRHPPLPYVPGVEAAGEVVSSSLFAVGERVWLRGAGLGTVRDGTWCELIDAPDEAIGHLPAQVSMTLGSAFFSPCTSAWVALHDVGRLQQGERVLVSGASGAVGSIAVQLARDAGAQVRALCVDRGAAARLPADVEPVFADALAADADLLLDMVGGDLLPRALRGLAPGGRAVLVGYAGGTRVQLDLPELLQRDIALLPLNMFRREAAGRAAAPALLERLAQGRLRLAVQEFPLADAARAMEWIAQRGHHGRAVLLP
jgi:NADPH2:quinone reductase